jgi:FMN phosphatase YigB (HAD superfamily)
LPDYIRCIWLSVSLQRLLEKDPHPTDALESLREVLSLGEWSAANRERMIETSYNAAQRSENHFKDRSIQSGASMIKAIIFDFGRVISAQKPPSLFRRYERDLGLAPGTLNPIMFGSQAWEETLLGRKTVEEFWHAIGPELGLKTPGEIDEFRRRYHSDSPPGIRRWLADWGILELFDVVFCSGDEGVMKPEPTSFRTTLDRLGVEPDEAVFIDDTMGHIEAARRLGVHGILFNTAEALEAELGALLEAQ